MARQPRRRPDQRLIELAREVRHGRSGSLDLAPVAAGLNVRVSSRRLSPPVQGQTVDEAHVCVDSRLSAPRHRFVVAHELGHVLVRRRAWLRPRDEESFADSFARELLVPVAELARGDSVITVSRSYGVEAPVAAAQLALAGHLPPVFRQRDGSVVCFRCGDRPGPTSCVCLQYRQRASLPAPMLA
jgi:hypothetical protein